jgi:hypothetical protein
MPYLLQVILGGRLILEKFKTEREKYNYYMSNLVEVDDFLKKAPKKQELLLIMF